MEMTGYNSETDYVESTGDLFRNLAGWLRSRAEPAVHGVEPFDEEGAEILFRALDRKVHHRPFLFRLI